MEKKPEIIVLTGPESTGKTYLARYLANYFNCSWKAEFAREYIENLHLPYNYKDIEIIAARQREQFKDLLKGEYRIAFMDTYLIITKVWFQEIYNTYPEWINKELKKIKSVLFLLCKDDIPWYPDGVREHKENRSYLFKRYQAELEYYNLQYKIIFGENENRINLAVEYINSYCNG